MAGPEHNPADDEPPTHEAYTVAMIERFRQDRTDHAAAAYLADEFIEHVLTPGAVEAKYGIIHAEKKKFHPGEPVFLFRAADLLAPTRVEEYAEYCHQHGRPSAHVAGCRKAAERMRQWQEDHWELVKLPD